MTAGDSFLTTDQLVGLTAYDRDGAKVGSVEQVFLDDGTGKPEWVTVKTGMFGMKETFVPLAGAGHDGEGLHLAYAKDTIKDAPRVDADEHLDAAEERELYAHYGVTRGGASGKTGDEMSGRGDTTSETGTGTQAAAAGTAGAAGAAGRSQGTGRPTEDRPLAGAGAGSPAMSRSGADMGDERATYADEMVRSEEQLRVGTEEQEVGRARLRKVVVTEDVSTTVPVSHEEVHLVREPIGEGDRTRGTEIGEAEAEVTLHAERPVVRKEAVPVERVRLETEKVTEQREVSDTVRKEEIQYDDGTSGASGEEDDWKGGRSGPTR
ncbi:MULTISPECIES: PRC and DUF2382 domain-containing protein [Streptomyces]|uniref:PRC-barrel domain-containing protein n=2 Tax=Streptomyces TaxID=1883 RepID=A0A380P3M3_STRGR|nr:MULTISPECIES: PRC and DUF2382 domain-containing protein [Streptomyces]NEE26922.1 PRC and DUF2382 domain-containing protein [Streptomyces sp. SID7982]MBL3803894.1 PRC and DUF2382 domain-containing protein [Streptomyces sp. BRB081]MDQ0296425.1 uncharacterized protein (TIGR02271 family) [Streptomyces sp. DSM 41037]PJM81368.1 photosystem reaction center subunit H [Streptomyces sp. TSRI0384-2]RPK86917.1 PRC-barrel domain protein [Streptomyces sp. ADI98-12]